ncbi:Fic family protein [uncultured Sphaerochaeta sp.]|uniref:Fic family protein n=1 Tax=uncultured Sphaerochaeta sp. TaxID=886478 RepID=UPI0029C9EEE8|nr:Fic family protein [uncultured Sphaerochaeta sp.]
MQYISTNTASKRWGISERRVRRLCNEGRIEGAAKMGRNWIIPDHANKPIDARKHLEKHYQGIVYDFQRIDALKRAIDNHRPFSATLVRSLHEKLLVEWTYHSNAIEGNTLTLSETKVVLEGLTIGGKTMVEHLEAINHREAILFIEQIISSKKILTEYTIRNIHSLILQGIDKHNAGAYRQENVLISGASHIPPKHYEVATLMEHLITEYRTRWESFHPVVRAMLLHGEFVKIHPFIDGNGRTARLLLNFELIRWGYPPVIIRKEQRATYYAALDTAHTTMQYGPFLELVATALLESEKLWLSVLD